MKRKKGLSSPFYFYFGSASDNNQITHGIFHNFNCKITERQVPFGKQEALFCTGSNLCSEINGFILSIARHHSLLVFTCVSALKI